MSSPCGMSHRGGSNAHYAGALCYCFNDGFPSALHGACKKEDDQDNRVIAGI